MRVVGLMSGTSADGIDAALVEIGRDQRRVTVATLAVTTIPYPDDLRAEVLAACQPQTGRVDGICRLNAKLGEWFARAVVEVVRQAGLSPAEVDLVGSHGQTIYHLTKPGEDPPSTLQIAAPAVIAERTGRTVVADFRPRDLAAGGQGAPLMSYVDYLLFTDATRARALQNLGGIANATYLPPGGGPDDIVAFDSGPGNLVIDALCQACFGQRFDRDGEIAARGRVDESLLDSLLAHPYFRQPLPKTTGREEFGEHFAADLHELGRRRGLESDDLVATATRFTARTIARAYADYLPPIDEVIVSGGGAANPTLIRWIGDELRRLGRDPALRRMEDLGFSADAKEAIGFAVLAHETIHGRVGTLPSATGARHAVVLGSIVPGDNYLELMRRVTGLPHP